MTRATRRIMHPAGVSGTSTRLYGKRIMLRPLASQDFEAWSEVRNRNSSWLQPWEPQIPPNIADPSKHRDAFSNRCAARDRERTVGNNFSFGLFVDGAFTGEVNLNNVLRGAMQCCTIGYWIDEARAGNGYIAEAVILLSRFAFDELQLHRIEVCVIPRNTNSRRVMEKLKFREEGIALRYLEINGVWEDHVRYGFTVEEWESRAEQLTNTWL
ncbi:MAG: GNAT family N-acetyltransferase [Ilumatobacteraceae bacterium]